MGDRSPLGLAWPSAGIAGFAGLPAWALPLGSQDGAAHEQMHLSHATLPHLATHVLSPSPRQWKKMSPNGKNRLISPSA